MKRVAYGRINQETNAFSPVATTLDDFQRLHYVEGEALAAAAGPGGQEIPGLLKAAELSGFLRSVRRHGKGGIEPVPLLSTWAMPSGPMTEDTFVTLRDALVRRLGQAGHLDGVFLALHGAMRAQGAVGEPEEAFLAAVRDVVGPRVPIALTLDLHGQLTPGKVDPTTILAAYRTNPHRDLARTGARAGALLIDTLEGRVHPATAWRSLPMVLGGGATLDFWPPMLSLFLRMKAMERSKAVLCTSLFMCHLWNDSPDLGWSCHVTTNGDQALAERLADELAERAWAVRHREPPQFIGAKEAIDRARQARIARRLGVVCLADASDIVGAGAPGESTHLLRALLEHGGGLLSYVPIRDAESVGELWGRRAGERVRVTLGGRFDPVRSPPLPVEGTLLGTYETQHFGRAVVLSIGDVRAVVTELGPYSVKPSFFSNVGLAPRRADIIVIKSFFHWLVYYAPIVRWFYLVRTEGVTDFDLVTQLEFNDPVFPKDQVQDWRPADRRRRGLGAPDPTPRARATPSRPA